MVQQLTQRSPTDAQTPVAAEVKAEMMTAEVKADGAWEGGGGDSLPSDLGANN